MHTFHRTITAIAIALMVAAGVVPALAQNTLQLTPPSLAFSAQAGSITAQTATLAVASSGSAGTAVAFLAGASTTSGGAWLTVSPQSGTTPASLTVTANPAGVPAGTYAGAVSVSIAGTIQTVPVSFSVGQLGATPAAVSFSYQMGSSTPPSQLVQLSSSATVPFTLTQTTATGGSWLQVAPVSGTAPGTISVSLNATVLASLAQGTYTGTITVTPSSGTTVPLSIPVTLTVSPVPQLTISPAALAFNYQIGGTNNEVQQPLSLASSGTALNFAAGVGTQSGGNWLVVTPTQGVTPATLTVGVQPGSLTAGTYTGTVTILAPGSATPTQTVQVILTVSTNPLLSLTPNALEFTYQIGTALPASKNITPVSTSTALTYTVGATTAQGGNWITIITPAGTTPNPISIGINPAGLTAGTYNGTVTVTGAGAGNPPQQVPVTLKVSNDALITANGSTSPAGLFFVYQTGQSALPTAQNLSISSTTGAQLSYTVTAGAVSGGNWLSVLGAAGATPGNATVQVNPTGVAAGTYDGTLTIVATNPATGAAVPNSPLTVPVKFYVSATALLNISQNAITLTSVNGAVTSQTLQLTSTSDQLSFTVNSTTASGGSWLVLGPASGTTPNAINVTAVPGSLAPGTYSGTITITAANPSGAAVADSPITIPVTLAVSSGMLSVPTTPLSFTLPVGGTAAPQTVTVSSTGGSLNFTASASTTTGVNWLTVTPTTSGTPAVVSIAVNATGLAQGTYQGNVTITSPGASNSPQSIPVMLTVTAAQTLQLNPAALTFNYQMGAAAPAAQTLQISSTGGTLNYSATVGSGATWLSLTPAAGPTPASVNVAVNPANLQAGVYNGTISVASPAASNSPQTLNVTLNVIALPTPVLTAVANAASYASGAIAPGEIVVLGGTNFGPSAITTLKLNAQGLVDTTLADTQVLFDSIPAPLVYVSGTQISAVVPYQLAGRLSTRIQVKYKDAISAVLEQRVTDAAPGIFTLNQSGTGPGAILNQDYKVNSPSTPAAKGSVVAIYATGEGATTPNGVNGRVAPTDGTGLATPLLPVTVLIGGKQAEVLYKGSAPGALAGLIQINARVPADVASGTAVPVVVTIGSASSQANVTLAVQ